ncbi:hypothetical protein [Brevibacterium sp.]|uniref:hypothetical protein n=1 Tax=Brevibacterium sp. TaxID=1701 RepID=UPI002811A159|nr:hypothetical protein [Brevibacterium sp.]
MIRMPIVTLLVVLTAAIAAPTHAIAMTEQKLETRGEFVSVATPAPGHSSEWTMSVRAPEEEMENLTITLVSTSGTAVSGPHPIEITLMDDEGQRLASGTAEQLRNEVIFLPTPREGGWLTLRATAALPFEAGDDYKGSRAELQFRFSAAMAMDVAEPDQLPFTGASGVFALLILAFVLIGTGVWLLMRSSRAEGSAEIDKQAHPRPWLSTRAENDGNES